MLNEGFFTRGKIKLSYVEGPDNGQPLLLLPAYDNRWQSYASILPQIASKTHLYALDPRGRGRSDRTPGAYRLEDSLKDTIDFIEQVVKQPCYIFGHSMGGWVGLWLASTRPDLVLGLIIGDSGLDIDALIEAGKSKEEREGNRKFKNWAGKPVEKLIQEFSERYPDRSPEYIEMRAQTFTQVDPEIYEDWVEGKLEHYFMGYDSEKVLTSIECPTLLLHAENGMISYEEIIWARELKENLNVRQMTGMDHWLGIQDGRGTAVISEIINFLYSDI